MFMYELEELHPLLIHFPIALLSVGVLCDYLGTFFKKESLLNAGWWCLLFGFLSTIFTIITGFLADELYGHMGEPFPLFETHGSLQIFSSLIFAGLIIWRVKNKSELPEKPLLYLFLGIAAVGVMTLFYGGFLGAELAGR